MLLRLVRVVFLDAPVDVVGAGVAGRHVELVLALDVFVRLSDKAALADYGPILLLFAGTRGLVGLDEQLTVQVNVVLVHVVHSGHRDGVD